MKSLGAILDHARIKWFIEDIWKVKDVTVDAYADFLSHYREFTPFHLN